MSKYKKRTIIDTSKNIELNSDFISFITKKNIGGYVLCVIYVFLFLMLDTINFLPNIIYQNNDKQISKIEPTKNPAKITDKNLNNLIINDFTELDGMTKEEVYNERIKYIDSSLFANQNYKPNEEVFGRIRDGKPWYGIDNIICYDHEANPERRADGKSFVSGTINNPNMLIGVNFIYPWTKEKGERYGVCEDNNFLFLPTNITYSKGNNLITAYFDLDEKFLKRKNKKYIFNGLNARDLGYEYGYIFNKKNITLTEEENGIDKDVYRFSDYLDVGSSCGISGGCNNHCPIQNSLIFKFYDNKTKHFEGNIAIIDFKLWKKYPNNKLSKADIYYRMLFTLKD